MLLAATRFLITNHDVIHVESIFAFKQAFGPLGEIFVVVPGLKSVLRG